MAGLVDGHEVLVGRKSWVLKQEGDWNSSSVLNDGMLKQQDERTSGAARALQDSHEDNCLPITFVQNTALPITEIFVSKDGELLGRLTFSDQLRLDAVECVQELKRKGMRCVVVVGQKVR